jgi:putative phosphoribosyl transferase
MAATADVDGPLGDVGLLGILTLPPRGRGVIVFSPRETALEKALVEARFATFLLDLVTPHGDIRVLADRVTTAIDGLTRDALVGDLPPRLADLRMGCFGAGRGAAAALVAAAERPDRVAAVVSHNGRPDLAGPALERVAAPTLLIVEGRDADLLTLNRQAHGKLPGESRLEIVPGAPDRISALARDWFVRHVGWTQCR